MIKVFIIGNGFDLAHGYKTSYADFINFYLAELNVHLRNNRSFKDELLNFSNSEYPHFKNMNEFKSYYNSGFTRKTSNLNYQTFFEMLINKSEYTNNWVDIEFEYYNYLKKFYSSDPNQMKQYKAIVEELNMDIKFLKTKLIEYIKLDINKPKDENRIYFSNEFFHSLKYWLFESDNVSVNDNKYVFLNFNYTETIQRYISKIKSTNTDFDYDVIDIHGSLEDNIDDIVFGYGDELDEDYNKIENLNENIYLNNIKSFNYLYSNKYRDFFKLLHGYHMPKIGGSRKLDYIVHILGHSCGISDRILLKNIFDNERCKRIQIHFHKRDDGTDDFFEKTQEISRHFDHNGKHEMRIRILPKNKCFPLKIM